MQSWRAELARRLRGVDRVAGDAVTVESTARLVAAIIQLAAVEHEILGSGMWDYQLWNDAVPARVPVDGGSACRSMCTSASSTPTSTSTSTAPRSSATLSSLALDDGGADAFRTFRSDLMALQASLDDSPAAPWRMEPKRLKANINA